MRYLYAKFCILRAAGSWTASDGDLGKIRRPELISASCRLLAVSSLLFFLCYSPLLAQKTDVVILENSTKIIGEIKLLERGRLNYSTDEMKMIYIDWVKVVHLSSRKRFQVETAMGRRYVGSFDPAAESGKMMLVTGTERLSLDLASVVRIYPLNVRIWDRFKGYLDVGFSLTRANLLRTWTLGTGISLRSQKWLADLAGSSYYSKQENVQSAQNNSLRLVAQRFFGKRWVGWGLLQAEQNKELALDLRLTGGGGWGRYFIQTNRSLLGVLGGLMATRERFTGKEEAGYSAEANFYVQFSTFRYERPNLDFTSTLGILPNLTTWGRVRSEFSARLNYEVFKDFYFGLNGFVKYDNHPPTVEASKYDYGLGSSIGWKF